MYNTIAGLGEKSVVGGQIWGFVHEHGRGTNTGRLACLGELVDYVFVLLPSDKVRLDLPRVEEFAQEGGARCQPTHA